MFITFMTIKFDYFFIFFHTTIFRYFFYKIKSVLFAATDWCQLAHIYQVVYVLFTGINFFNRSFIFARALIAHAFFLELYFYLYFRAKTKFLHFLPSAQWLISFGKSSRTFFERCRRAGASHKGSPSF